MTTLTLNIDRHVVADVEVYAKRTKKTVPQLVEEFLLSISRVGNSARLSVSPERSARSSSADKTKIEALGPITSRLTGVMKLDKDVDYKELLTGALMEKYL